MKINFVLLGLLLIFCTFFGQTFTEIDAGLIGVYGSSVTWGDNEYKSDYYSYGNVNTFWATCEGADWDDYPYMDTVVGPLKFYYKRVGSTDEYTEIVTEEPPAKDVTYYKQVWDSRDLRGEYIVKATAFYYESAESTELLTCSDSLTIWLLDGFECKITA